MNDRESLVQRRQTVHAMLLAVEQAPKLLQVCAAVTGDHDDAVRAVCETFAVSDNEAHAILALQVIRFTPHRVQQTRDELADIDRRLDRSPS